MRFEPSGLAGSSFVEAEAPPDLPLDRAVVRPRQRIALVQYIRGSRQLQESDYLEWKCGLDVRKRRAAVAKHLIGFANRTVAAAERHFEGHAYLVLGVEPGRYEDVDPWDRAQVEDWLAPFVEDELRYDADYVEVDGHRVLVFDVESPRPGDPIYALQKASEDEDGKNLREGVYVRRPGKTEPANANDIRALSARLLARLDHGPNIECLDLAVDDREIRAIPAHMLTNENRDQVLERYRREAMAPVPDPHPFLGHPAALMGSRGPEEFANEVEKFVAQAKRHWWEYIACEFAERTPAVLKVAVVNDTDDHYEQVEVELRLPVPRMAVHLDATDAFSALRPPEKPEPWSDGFTPLRRTRLRLRTPGQGVGASISADGSGMALISFASVHVRPHGPQTLQPLSLTLAPGFAGQTLTAEWRVTAVNTKSHQRGTVEIHVGNGG